MKLIFPSEVLDQHLIALGKTGAGKSSALRHVVEWLLAHKKRVCIIDPKGDWYGLKASADGKGPGFSVVLFGDFKDNIKSDVPLIPHSQLDNADFDVMPTAKHVAELVVSGNRPCVIGMRGWTQGNMTRFWIEFAPKVFNSESGELYLVNDEIHNFAPKGKVLSLDAGKSLHWTNRLINEGRGIGLMMFAASQRPQKVHNDTLDACETLIAMRVVHPAARKAIKDWLDGAGDKASAENVYESLAGLERGEAIVWSPEIKFGPQRVRFPMFETYDSFAPPKLQKTVSEKGWATVDLTEVREKLASVIAKAKADDPVELKKINSDLRSQLRKLESAKPQTTVETKTKTEIKKVEKRVVMSSDISRLEKATESFDGIVERLRESFDRVEIERSKIAVLLTEAREINEAANREIAPQPVPVSSIRARQTEGYKPTITHHQVAAQLDRMTATNGDKPKVGKGEMITLRAIVQHGSVARNQLTVLTGYKRSTRDAYIQRLGTWGLIGPSATPGEFSPTEEGIARAGEVDMPPTGRELIEWWHKRLPGGEREVFDFVVGHGGNVTREEIDEATGYARSSRDAYLQRLTSRKLIEVAGAGTVRPSAMLS